MPLSWVRVLVVGVLFVGVLVVGVLVIGVLVVNVLVDVLLMKNLPSTEQSVINCILLVQACFDQLVKLLNRNSASAAVIHLILLISCTGFLRNSYKRLELKSLPLEGIIIIMCLTIVLELLR